MPFAYGRSYSTPKPALAATPEAASSTPLPNAGDSWPKAGPATSRTYCYDESRAPIGSEYASALSEDGRAFMATRGSPAGAHALVAGMRRRRVVLGHLAARPIARRSRPSRGPPIVRRPCPDGGLIPPSTRPPLPVTTASSRRDPSHRLTRTSRGIRNVFLPLARTNNTQASDGCLEQRAALTRVASTRLPQPRCIATGRQCLGSTERPWRPIQGKICSPESLHHCPSSTTPTVPCASAHGRGCGPRRSLSSVTSTNLCARSRGVRSRTPPLPRSGAFTSPLAVVHG